MRDLTIQELDNQLAEQLPARELMGSCWHPCGSTFSHGGNTRPSTRVPTTATATATATSG